MLDQLERYYRQHGILATSFTCSHRSQSEQGCPGFTGPKSAFISSGYENGRLPRSLFPFARSGSGDRVDGNRLPAAVQQHEEFQRSFAQLLNTSTGIAPTN